MTDVKLTAKGNRFYRLRRPGVPVTAPHLSQHTDLANAYEAAVKDAAANEIDGTYTVQPPDGWEIETMGFRVASAPPPASAGQVWLNDTVLSVVEGNAFSLTARRGNGSSGAIAVDWSISIAEGAPAVASGTFSWANGDTADKSVSLTAGLVTQNRTGTITLSNARSTSGGATPAISGATASLTITNIVVTARSVKFVTNSSGSPVLFDHGRILVLPSSYGVGEFTDEIYVKADNTKPVGSTSGGSGQLVNWSDADNAPYSTIGWWYHGNFLEDGHNNTSLQANALGTHSLQVYGGGRLRWLFGDNAPELQTSARTGYLHAVQAAVTAAAPSLLDGKWHRITRVRRTNGSGATLELWFDDQLIATTTTSVMRNMRTWWDTWTGFPANERGIFIAAEKQAAVGAVAQWESFDGKIAERACWNVARSPAQIAASWNKPRAGNESGLVGLWRMNVGGGLVVQNSLASGQEMTIHNASSGLWDTEGPAPAAPTGLTASAVSSSAVQLSWAAAEAFYSGDVKDYRVYRNGALIATVTTLSYTDTGLSTGTAYNYRVAARNAADVEGAVSTQATATTQGGGTGTFLHGQIVTVNGDGFGTRPDYNAANYLWNGHRHIHFRWSDLGDGEPATNSESAWLAATRGFFAPSNYVGRGVRIVSGGPSFAGRYLRRTYGTVGDGSDRLGGLQVVIAGAPNPLTMLYACFKMRMIGTNQSAGNAQGKLWRMYTNASGVDLIIGPEVLNRQGGASNWQLWWNGTFVNNTFRRIELDLLSGGSRFRSNGSTVSAGNSTYNGGVPVSTVPYFLSGSDSVNGRTIDLPNMVDDPSVMPGVEMSFADPYYDFTRARVEVAGANGKVEIQPVTEWINSRFRFALNVGEMTSGPAEVRLINSAGSIIRTEVINISRG